MKIVNKYIFICALAGSMGTAQASFAACEPVTSVSFEFKSYPSLNRLYQTMTIRTRTIIKEYLVSSRGSAGVSCWNNHGDRLTTNAFNQAAHFQNTVYATLGRPVCDIGGVIDARTWAKIESERHIRYNGPLPFYANCN